MVSDVVLMDLRLLWGASDFRTLGFGFRVWGLGCRERGLG